MSVSTLMRCLKCTNAVMKSFVPEGLDASHVFSSLKFYLEKNKKTIYYPKYSNSVDSILKNRTKLNATNIAYTIHAIEDKNDYVVTFDCENKCF